MQNKILNFRKYNHAASLRRKKQKTCLQMIVYILSYSHGKEASGKSKKCKICGFVTNLYQIFWKPRISGSHHIFKMPWQGDPRINIQKDGNMAKEYQVKNVAKAIEKLENEPQKQIGQNKAKEKKHEGE
jgi:hypothetical protein